jgi:hypothetical protein
MAQNFQSSFIPSGPMTEEKVFKQKKAGILGVLAVSLFITSIIAAVAIYVYKGMVQSDIQNMESELALAEKSIDNKSIADMSQFGKKLGVVKNIISKHQAISGFINSLASSTVSTVQFIEFNYGDIKDGTLSVSLRGRASSYAAVALQESVFSKTKYFKSTAFSGLNLTTDGLVSFDLTILIDPQISIYASQSNINI